MSPRKFSYNNDSTYEHFNRRPSATSIGGDMTRKYSNCSEGYSSCSDMSRRTSACSSEMSRRSSNCSEAPVFSRRSSNCSDFCSCSRRPSQCSDQFRRISQCSDGPTNIRRFSNASNFERRLSGSDGSRRISFDSDYDRKMSIGSGSGPCEHHRKLSGTYDPMVRKYSNGEQYMRKISTDSGYDRKISIGSIGDYESTSPRSRSNSFMMGKTENLVRTPLGPDGSKGFSRARKVGHVIV